MATDDVTSLDFVPPESPWHEMELSLDGGKTWFPDRKLSPEEYGPQTCARFVGEKTGWHIIPMWPKDHRSDGDG